MKEFRYDLSEVDPVDVARRDHMEFFVESIIDHRDVKLRSTAQFLVKLKDYPPSSNSWEPYSSLRDVEALHE